MKRKEIRKAADSLIDHGLEGLDRETIKDLLDLCLRSEMSHRMDGYWSWSFGVEDGVVINTGDSYDPFPRVQVK